MNPNLTKPASGIYIKPVSLTGASSRSKNIIHPISIIPDYLRTKELLKLVVEDIARFTLHKISGFDPDGNPTVIFLDTVGYIADFKETADGVDTLSHSGSAGCNLCSFRRFEGNAGNSSLFAYTTNINSHDASSKRSAERHKQLRDNGISEKQCSFLGLNSSSRPQKEIYPPLVLHDLLRKEIDYLHPIKHHFDAFDNIVAPDHLLVGLIRNALRVLFSSLETKSEKQALRRIDLPREKYVGNVSKGRNGELYTTSFNNTFGIFHVAPVVVQQFKSIFRGRP